MSEKLKATGCFIESGGEILLLHRRDDVPQPNTWALPGGKVGDDETAKEAIKKKVKAEIDQEPEHLEFLGEYSFSYPDQEVNFSAFLWKTDDKPEVDLNPEGHDDFGWFDPQKAYQRDDLMAGMYTLLEEIYNTKNK